MYRHFDFLMFHLERVPTKLKQSRHPQRLGCNKLKTTRYLVQAYISYSSIIRLINKSRYSLESYLTRIVRLRRVSMLCTEFLSNEHLVIFTYASGLVSDSASTIQTNVCLVVALMKLPIVSYNAYDTNVKASMLSNTFINRWCTSNTVIFIHDVYMESCALVSSFARDHVATARSDQIIEI